jgi:hypothetical protein
MEIFLRVFLVLAGLTVVTLILRNPSGSSTVINSLAQGSSTTFGTFINGVPSSA